ncbi:hypothetical protein AC629_03270 [Bradyrhizobium sp. NAS80.1]|nr:hypothetical protein AC629_03270 [Bradyrhizobium sp. NAS80.1]
MLKKSLLTIALLAALSATAQAGATISDKRYWPNEARASAQYTTSSQRNASSAFAYDRGASVSGPATIAIEDRSPWRYHGGPKSH